MRRQTGQSTDSLVGKLPVYVGLQGESNFPHKGVLDFAASELNILTGSLQLRGRFDNVDQSILPGVYTKVLVNYGEKRESLLVPAEVILRDPQGTYVFLVGQDKKVERRNIQTGQSFGRLVEVSQGLKPDDAVVINGLVTLSVGQTVDPETGAIAPALLPGAGPAPVANQPKG
jgi:RND family efflux transporter MFP subunit